MYDVTSVCELCGVCVCWWLFFFFKQKTAYEIEYGLVGSEMCIRDRAGRGQPDRPAQGWPSKTSRKMAAALLTSAAQGIVPSEP